MSPYTHPHIHPPCTPPHIIPPLYTLSPPLYTPLALYTPAKQDDTIEGFEALQSKVKDFVAEHPDLARAKDLDGRIAIEVASAPIRR